MATKVTMNATVRTGAGTPRFSLLRFYPIDTTVKVGGTVTWKWTGFNEVHTVTIAPADVLDALDATLFGPPGAPADPVGALPTEAPGAPVVHTADVHGNGLLGSGIISDPGGGDPNKFMAQVQLARRVHLRVPHPRRDDRHHHRQGMTAA